MTAAHFSNKVKPGPEAIHLVNKDYYDRALAEMKAREAEGEHPTVRDFLRAMRKQGNGAYFDQFKEFVRKREDAFQPNGISHEIPHLAAHIGHTPQQELSVLYFMEGLKAGPAAQFATDMDVAMMEMKEVEWRKAALDYQDTKSDPASKRDRAIYYAAGLYMRSKLEQYVQQRQFDKPVESRLKFCNGYAKRDHAPSLGDFKEGLFSEHNTHIEDAPYQLITFSREADKGPQRVNRNTSPGMHGRGEWSSIVAVATGLCEPNNTDYPKRLTSVKQVLVRSHLYCDTKQGRNAG